MQVFPVKHFGGLELLLEQELELARSGGDQGGGSAFSEKDFDAVLLAREAFSRVQAQPLAMASLKQQISKRDESTTRLTRITLLNRRLFKRPGPDAA